MHASRDVTELLQAWNDGDAAALDELIPLVYDELHELAQKCRRGDRPGDLLQTTALIHEAYVRLLDAHALAWKDRTHLFAITARLMRQILVDFSRRRTADKRGGRLRRQPLDDILANQREIDLLAVDEALQELAEIDPRKAEMIELRFFGGLGVDETARALNVSPETVRRDWRLAKSWLRRFLDAEQTDGR